MSLSVRARRLEHEWEFLGRLAAHNPAVVEVVRREVQPDAEVFHIVLNRTSALRLASPHALLDAASHAAWFRYPEYYPSVPIEAFLAAPVFHANIHPETGFVCVWSRHSAGDTILEAVRQLQRVITWELSNSSAEHVMQPEALEWVPGVPLPLACEPVRVPADLQFERSYARRPASRRRRLTE